MKNGKIYLMIILVKTRKSHEISFSLIYVSFLFIETNREIFEKLINDDPFLTKLKAKLFSSKTAMLEGHLEGASVFREVCKIICSLLTMTYQDENLTDEEPDVQEEIFTQRIHVFEKFCNFIDLAPTFINLLKQALDKGFTTLKEVISRLFERVFK